MKSLSLKFYLLIIPLLNFGSCQYFSGEYNTLKKDVLPNNIDSLLFNDTLVYDFIKAIDFIDSNSTIVKEIDLESKKGFEFYKEVNGKRATPFRVDSCFFELDKENSNFVRQQLKNAKGKNWNYKILGNDVKMAVYEAWMKNNEFDWDKFRYDGFGCITELGIPLFNKERTVAVIHIGTQCHATLGSGYLYIFNKVGNNWVITCKTMTWIS